MNDNEQVLGDYGDYDDANAFGLGADGRPVGWNPMWGSTISAGVGTLTSVIVRQATSKDKYAELFGFGAAALPSLAMVFPKRTRAAGWAGLITAVLNNGVRFAEQMLSSKEEIKAKVGEQVTQQENAAQNGQQVAPPAPTPDAAAPGTQQGVNVQRIPAFAGPQWGLVVPQAEQALQGASAPQLLGQAPQLLGATAGQMSGHYGSTHFNKA